MSGKATLAAWIEWAKQDSEEHQAIAIALESAGQEGAHHKQWVIDQMLRCIAGQMYPTMVDLLRQAGHEWDTGIP